MSHVTTYDGLMIPKDRLSALRKAVERWCPELEMKKGSHYRTWKDTHQGRLVGDWPLPEGMTAAEVGENAEYVISTKATHDPRQMEYEIGVVPMKVKRDANGKVLSAKPDKKGTEYALVCDFYMQGNGILKRKGVGQTKPKPGTAPGRGQPHIAFEDLYMHFQMEVAREKAEIAGDTIEFEKQADGTFVGKVNTAQRLGIA